MLSRLIEPRLRKTKKSVLLLGPRQVGKSTLCRSLNPLRTINLAEEALYVGYAKDPGRLLRELKAETKTGLIVIDEIQRVPALLNSIQAHLDETTRHRFILTGSSARKLKRGGANLLPGRLILEHLDSLTYWELGEEFNLNKVLSQGSLPGVYLDRSEGLAVLATYAQVYLREEIQAEALTKNIGSYARFLDVAAEASGQWINYSKLASDIELPKETVRRFFEILEETLVVFRVPAYVPAKTHRRLSQRDRFIFFDLGVRNALLGLHNQSLSPHERGRLFEQWVLLQCLAYGRAHQKNWKIQSFRTDTGLEVDVVIDTGRVVVGIECKAGSLAHYSDARGLQALGKMVSIPMKKYIVYQGTTSQQFEDGTRVFSYSHFLEKILPAI